MVKRVESIVEQALTLDVSDRATVIRKLIESLDDVPVGGEETALGHAQTEGDAFFTDPAIEQAWAEEIQRRVERMERGEVKLIPGDEVRRKIRKMIDERLD